MHRVVNRDGDALNCGDPFAASCRRGVAKPLAGKRPWPTPQNIPLPAMFLSGYRKVVTRYNGDADAMLSASGLDPRMLDDLSVGISLKEAAKLLEITAAAIGCPDLGMQLAAMQSGLELMGPAQTVLESAQTIRDYYVYACKFMHVYSSEIRIYLEALPDPGLFAVRFELQAKTVPYRRQLMEQFLAMNRDDTIALSGGKAYAKEIWFAHRALASSSTYLKRYGAMVHFCQPFDAVIYSAEDMNTRILSSNKLLLEAALAEVSTNYPYHPHTSMRVREVISRYMAHQVDCGREAIAMALGLHPRTLLRRLRQEATTFEVIKDEVRRDLAFHYLAQSDITLTEIAARLHYAEPAAFSRACRKWVGTSPSKLRRSLMSRIWVDDWHGRQYSVASV
jgi:AraC-like DNA-binding protein